MVLQAGSADHLVGVEQVLRSRQVRPHPTAAGGENQLVVAQDRGRVGLPVAHVRGHDVTRGGLHARPHRRALPHIVRLQDDPDAARAVHLAQDVLGVRRFQARLHIQHALAARLAQVQRARGDARGQDDLDAGMRAVQERTQAFVQFGVAEGKRFNIDQRLQVVEQQQRLPGREALEQGAHLGRRAGLGVTV